MRRGEVHSERRVELPDRSDASPDRDSHALASADDVLPHPPLLTKPAEPIEFVRKSLNLAPQPLLAGRVLILLSPLEFGHEFLVLGAVRGIRLPVRLVAAFAEHEALRRARHLERHANRRERLTRALQQ